MTEVEESARRGGGRGVPAAVRFIRKIRRKKFGGADVISDEEGLLTTNENEKRKVFAKHEKMLNV